jgi:hypothetical protein
MLRQIALGDIVVGIGYARDLAKAKDSLRFTLGLFRAYARHALRTATASEEQARWGVFLANVIAAEAMVFDRNLAAGTVLTSIFLSLAAGPEIFPVTAMNELLVQRQAV